MGAAWARYGDLSALSPAEARRIAEEVRAPWTRGGPQMASITELSAEVSAEGRAPVRMRVYDPGPAGIKPALIYLHGGGWALFSLDTHDRLMREYASRAGVAVIGIDYALSPEAKFPVALQQVVSATRYIAQHGHTFGIDPGRMAIGGDSAGANLALSAALGPGSAVRGAIRAIVLNYGVFARQSSPEARRQFGGAGNMLTADEMEGFWRNYLRDEGDAEDPRACPIRADLRGLPPVFLAVPECDLLTEQSVKLAELLKKAGVIVHLEMYRGAMHSFLEAVSISALARRAFDDTAKWLRATLQ